MSFYGWIKDSLGNPFGASEDLPMHVRQGKGDLINDAWHIPKVSLPHSLFHGMWTFDIPESMWFIYENGVQVHTPTTVTSVGGVAQLQTTALIPDVVLESRVCPRYQPNRGHHFASAGWHPSKTLDGVREWGLSTPFNGVFFRLKSDGLLYAVLLSGGTETREEVIDTSGVLTHGNAFDVEKNNVFDIHFQWRSAGDYTFFINLQEVHSFDLLGTLSTASIENPAMPIHVKALRTTQDVTMYMGCADITSDNGSSDMQQYASMYTEAYSGAGADFPVICLYQPLLINAETNTRTTSIARLTVNSSKKSRFKVWTTRNPADIIGATFRTHGHGSFIETDSTDMDATAVRATSVATANLHPISIINTEANVRSTTENPDPLKINFAMVRGDYLIVTCSDATATTDCVVEVGEHI